MKRIASDLLWDAKCKIGEGPVYDDLSDTLYWVDITGQAISCLQLASDEYTCIKLGRTVGSIALVEGGGLIAALNDGLYVLRDMKLIPLCKPESIMPEHRMNDGKCDRMGRFFGGAMCVPENGPRAHLYKFAGNGTYETVLDGIGCSNGLAWNSDYTEFYYIDTLLNEPTYVRAFDYDESTGTISNPRVVIDYSDPSLDTPGSAPAGVADGMTIDAEGMLWIAEWGGSKVSRFDPSTGEKLAEVVLPVSRPACCTFGGAEMDTLFITTAAEGCEDEEYAGGVFYAKTGVKGLKPNRFKIAV